MVKTRASILIDRRQEQVFGFIAEDFIDNYARWSPEVKQIETLTPGPISLGSRMRQVWVDQGRRSENQFTVTALQSPERLEFAESSDLFRTGYWQFTIRPLFDRDNNLIYYLGIQYDVTEQVRAKEELARLNDLFALAGTPPEAD